MLLSSATANYRLPLAFISDRQHMKGGATPYQFAL